MQTKTCTKCGRELPATSEYFQKRKNVKSGIGSICKKCAATTAQEWRKNNKERYLELARRSYWNNREIYNKRSKEWHEKNTEKVKEYRKQYYAQNKATILLKNKEYYKLNNKSISSYRRKWQDNNRQHTRNLSREYYYKNKDEQNKKRKERYWLNRDLELETRRQYYKDNKEHLLQKGREWYLDHRDDQIKKALNRTHIRNARKRLLASSLTSRQWDLIKKEFLFCCAYCGSQTKLTREHFIPLIGGGEYTKYNIIPACQSCNSSKRDKPFEEWYPEQPFYSKERERFIYEHFTKMAEENGGWGRSRSDLGTLTIIINEQQAI